MEQSAAVQQAIAETYFKQGRIAKNIADQFRTVEEPKARYKFEWKKADKSE